MWLLTMQTLIVSGRGMSWPLCVLLPRLSLLHYVWNYWETFTRPQTQVLRDFELACDALSQRLGREEFFFPSKFVHNAGINYLPEIIMSFLHFFVRMTTLDVAVFGYLQAITSKHLPSSELLKIVQQHENLTNFCQRISALPEILHTVPTTQTLEQTL